MMQRILLLVLIALFYNQCYSAAPDRFVNFLLRNTWNTSTLPLSYRVPPGYYQGLTPSPYNKAGQYAIACGRDVTAQELDNYRLQTEQFLTTFGLNLYDGAVREIALTLLGHAKEAQQYEVDTLVSGKTFQLANIRASTPCQGIMYFKQCNDTQENGACGFCYGGNDGGKGVSFDTKHAFFFRMIGDVYAFAGTKDARCPEKAIPWTWNDWRPVAGENGWANFLAPLQVAYIQAGKNVNSINDNSPAIQLATQILDTFQKMQMPNGAIAYAPYNTYDELNPALGGTASVENAASSLAGLRFLLQIFQNKQNTQYKSLVPTLQDITGKLTNFIKTAYSPSAGYFLQGGTYNQQGVWKWNDDPSEFAVDCQTWVISVLGAPLVDQWFGAGTSLKIWSVTKKIGGYRYNAQTDSVLGVGFSQNQQDQVFSGEWSFGAVNMLRILAKQLPANSADLLNEANAIRDAIEAQLTSHEKLIDSDVVNYANKRYLIPFGWYSNPIPSLASVSWAVMLDSNFNPFVLGGAYVA